jgi:hypothetical protein
MIVDQRAIRCAPPWTPYCSMLKPSVSQDRSLSHRRGDLVNLRENAGWSADAAGSGPKMAALAAAAAEPMPDVSFIGLESEGIILVYGRDERAIEAGNLLKDHLDVTVLLTQPENVAPPGVTDFPTVKGTIRSAKGHLGAFEISIDDFAAPLPSSCNALAFGTARDGATSRCDILLDVSGGYRCFRLRTCVTAICARIPAIPPLCSKRCRALAIWWAISTSRAT